MRHSPGVCTSATLLALALLSGTAVAQPQPARPPAAAPAPDPAFEAAQRVFDALPEAERKAIQDDLIWGSDFTATISGSFGRRTYDALIDFQKAAKLKPDGVLDAGGRKLLGDAATKARTAAKFASVTDPKTEARIGVPAALLSKREVLTGGTRWSAPNGKTVLESTVQAGGTADLPALYERIVAFAAPGRKVTYKLLRPDFFVVAGEIGTQNFYTRFGVGPTSLRGYTLSYPAAQAKALDRYVIAIANSFQPTPGAAGVAATSNAPGAGTRPATPPPPETWPAGVFQTGIVVAQGKIVTAARADSCPEITVNRKPARIAAMDRQAGLALLEADTGQARPIRFTTLDLAKAAEAPVVIGYGTGSPGPVVTVSSGSLIVAPGAVPRLTAPLAREAAGSAVFDRHGGFIGMVAAHDGKPRLVAGLVPTPSHRLIEAGNLAKAAGATETPAVQGAPLSAGAIAVAARGSLVSVECARAFPR